MNRYLTRALVLLALLASGWIAAPPVSAQVSGIINGATPIVGGTTGQCVTRAANGTVLMASCTGAGVVSSWSGGSTGLLPSTATTGAVTVTGVIVGANGGTGVANTGKTITLGGNLVTSGAFATTLTSTGTTGVTLPTTGTLATLAGSEALTNKTINGQTITAGAGTLTLGSVTLNAGAGGTLGSNAFTSTAYAPLASPTFTGVVTIPTPFTLGAVSVTSTGTQLNYLSAATGTTGTASTNVVFSASPTFTGTVTHPTPFTLGATSVTTTGTQFNYLNAATGTTGTASTNIVFSASPTFTGTVTHPTPFTLGATSVTTTGTQLNYLNAATGTTGTASTSVVFSTSPTLVTPVLGVATGTSLALGGATLGTNVFAGVGTAILSGATTTGPDWEVWINGDTFARAAVGVNVVDGARFSMGPGNAARDVFIERAGAANMRSGGPDAAAPVAQIDSVQNVVVGTSNTAGAARSYYGSQSTGTGLGGSHQWYVSPAGSTGTAVNALALAATLDSTKTLTLAGPLTSTSLTDVLEIRRGTNPQFAFIYNTYTSASVNEYVELGFSTNIAYLVTDQIGATNRDLHIGTNGGATNLVFRVSGVSRVNLSTTAFTPANSVYALGTAGAGFNGLWLGTAADRTVTAGLVAPALNTLQMGGLDAAAPAAQTFRAQSVVAGTSNTAGTLWRFDDSGGTGSAASGGFAWFTHPLGGSGTSQNTAVQGLALSSAGNLTVAGNLASANTTFAISSASNIALANLTYFGTSNPATAGGFLTTSGAGLISTSYLGFINSTNPSTGTVDVAFSRLGAGSMGVGTGVAGSVAGNLQAAYYSTSSTNTQTGSTYTIASTDSYVIHNFAGTVTDTLPAASSFTGRQLTLRTITANTVVSASSNVVPLAGGSAGTAILAATAGKWARLVSDGTNWQIMEGN